MEKSKMKSDYEKEISNVRNEIHQKLLGEISSEIHDNVGQILSVTKLVLHQLIPINEKNQILKQEALSGIENCSTQLRGIAHSLKWESHLQSGLVDAVQNIFDKINKSSIKAEVLCSGDMQYLQKEVELVLYRIIQEFVSNSLKHSECTALKIIFNNHEKNHLKITIMDNGTGFESENIEGIGLKTMPERAKLFDINYNLHSSNEGTVLELIYFYPTSSKETNK